MSGLDDLLEDRGSSVDALLESSPPEALSPSPQPAAHTTSQMMLYEDAPATPADIARLLVQSGWNGSVTPPNLDDVEHDVDRWLYAHAPQLRAAGVPPEVLFQVPRVRNALGRYYSYVRLLQSSEAPIGPEHRGPAVSALLARYPELNKWNEKLGPDLLVGFLTAVRNNAKPPPGPMRELYEQEVERDHTGQIQRRVRLEYWPDFVRAIRNVALIDEGIRVGVFDPQARNENPLETDWNPARLAGDRIPVLNERVWTGYVSAAPPEVEKFPTTELDRQRAVISALRAKGIETKLDPNDAFVVLTAIGARRPPEDSHLREEFDRWVKALTPARAHPLDPSSFEREAADLWKKYTSAIETLSMVRGAVAQGQLHESALSANPLEMPWDAAKYARQFPPERRPLEANAGQSVANMLVNLGRYEEAAQAAESHKMSLRTLDALYDAHYQYVRDHATAARYTREGVRAFFGAVLSPVMAVSTAITRFARGAAGQVAGQEAMAQFDETWARNAKLVKSVVFAWLGDKQAAHEALLDVPVAPSYADFIDDIVNGKIKVDETTQRHFGQGISALTAALDEILNPIRLLTLVLPEGEPYEDVAKFGAVLGLHAAAKAPSWKVFDGVAWHLRKAQNLEAAAEIARIGRIIESSDPVAAPKIGRRLALALERAKDITPRFEKQLEMARQAVEKLPANWAPALESAAAVDPALAAGAVDELGFFTRSLPAHLQTPDLMHRYAATMERVRRAEELPSYIQDSYLQVWERRHAVAEGMRFIKRAYELTIEQLTEEKQDVKPLIVERERLMKALEHDPLLPEGGALRPQLRQALQKMKGVREQLLVEFPELGGEKNLFKFMKRLRELVPGKADKELLGILKDIEASAQAARLDVTPRAGAATRLAMDAAKQVINETMAADVLVKNLLYEYGKLGQLAKEELQAALAQPGISFEKVEAIVHDAAARRLLQKVLDLDAATLKSLKGRLTETNIKELLQDYQPAFYQHPPVEFERTTVDFRRALPTSKGLSAQRVPVGWREKAWRVIAQLAPDLDPESFYFKTKGEAEAWIKENRPYQAVRLRPVTEAEQSIYGLSHDAVLSRMAALKRLLEDRAQHRMQLSLVEWGVAKRFDGDVPGYIRLPNEERFGALAGMSVPVEALNTITAWSRYGRGLGRFVERIQDVLSAAGVGPRGGVFHVVRSLMGTGAANVFRKALMTSWVAMNARAYMAAAVFNTFAGMIGVGITPLDFAKPSFWRGVRKYMEGHADIQELQRLGVAMEDAGRAARRAAGDLVSVLFEESPYERYRRVRALGAPPEILRGYAERAGVTSRSGELQQRISKALSTIGDYPWRVYGAIDAAMKAGYMEVLRARGLSMHEIAERLRAFMQNYTMVPPTVKALSQNVLGAFVTTFPYEALRIWKNMLLRRPGHLMLFYSMLESANAIGLASSGLTMEEAAMATGEANPKIGMLRTLNRLWLPNGYSIDLANLLGIDAFLTPRGTFGMSMRDLLRGDDVLTAVAHVGTGIASAFILNNPTINILTMLNNRDPYTGRRIFEHGEGHIGNVAMHIAWQFLPGGGFEGYWHRILFKDVYDQIEGRRIPLEERIFRVAAGGRYLTAKHAWAETIINVLDAYRRNEVTTAIKGRSARMKQELTAWRADPTIEGLANIQRKYEITDKEFRALLEREAREGPERLFLMVPFAARAATLRIAAERGLVGTPEFAKFLMLFFNGPDAYVPTYADNLMRMFAGASMTRQKPEEFGAYLMRQAPEVLEQCQKIFSESRDPQVRFLADFVEYYALRASAKRP